METRLPPQRCSAKLDAVREYMNSAESPNRWMHVRQPAGFSPETFDVFCASAEIFVAHARALLKNWRRLPDNEDHPPIEYVFFPPELSDDRQVASLPIGGRSTLGTRLSIENLCSYMLWQYLPMHFMEGLDEGLTETIDSAQGPKTYWRLPASAIHLTNADPELRRRLSP